MGVVQVWQRAALIQQAVQCFAHGELRVPLSLIAHAGAAGVSESEAVRQWLTAHLARPQLLRSPVTGPREDRLPPIRASRDLVDRVRREAQRRNLGVAELIRRVVATHAV